MELALNNRSITVYLEARANTIELDARAIILFLWQRYITIEREDFT
jgi:hypothetical protein